MPSIDFRRLHHTSRHQARRHVDELAMRLKAKFGVDSRWQDDTLRLRHAGLDGSIDVDDQAVHVKARLGMLLGALKGRIEDELKHKLDACFGPESGA